MAYVGLAFCNVYFDIKSWQSALPPLNKEPLRKALRTHLEAMAWGLITPASIGEYAGRSMRFSKQDMQAVLSSTTIFKFSRIVARQFIGIVALGSLYLLALPVPQGPWWIVPILAILAVPAVVFLLRNGVGLEVLPTWLKQLFPDPNVWKSNRFYASWAWASTKFLSYTFQLTLLLVVLGSAEAGATWLLCMAFYFIAAWIPVVGFLDGLVKSGLAALWFGSVGVDVALAAAATFAVWLINSGTQSLVGSVLLLIKLKR